MSSLSPTSARQDTAKPKFSIVPSALFRICLPGKPAPPRLSLLVHWSFVELKKTALVPQKDIPFQPTPPCQIPFTRIFRIRLQSNRIGKALTLIFQDQLLRYLSYEPVPLMCQYNQPSHLPLRTKFRND